MIDLTPQAFAILRRQHGHASVAQLFEAGVGRNARRRLIEGGELVAVHRSVLRISSAPRTFESRCVAICLAHPAVFITGPSGGRIVALRRMPATEPIHVCALHGVHLSIGNVVLRQSRHVSPLDFVRMSSGIVVASGPRLAFDLARDLAPLDHASVVEQMIQRKICTMGTLGATARRLCHPTRPGSELFARTLIARGDRPASESHPEVVLAEALRARGIPVQPQFRDLDLPNGSSVRLDLAVPAARWGIEIDVHPDHLLLDGTTKDKRRDRQCHRIGWQIERVTEIDLLDFDGLVDELVALYETRVHAAA
jgi:very-short-patch-repair endonuclease